MQKLTLFVFIVVIGTTLSTVYAANGFCRRCQEIEEERRKNPPKEYAYYEDFLEEQTAPQGQSDVQSGESMTKQPRIR